jgi:hypothetical protein
VSINLSSALAAPLSFLILNQGTMCGRQPDRPFNILLIRWRLRLKENLFTSPFSCFYVLDFNNFLLPRSFLDVFLRKAKVVVYFMVIGFSSPFARLSLDAVWENFFRIYAQRFRLLGTRKISSNYTSSAWERRARFMASAEAYTFYGSLICIDGGIAGATTSASAHVLKSSVKRERSVLLEEKLLLFFASCRMIQINASSLESPATCYLGVVNYNK